MNEATQRRFGLEFTGILLALVALAGAVRFFGLGAESLWGDEINMVQFGQGLRPLELNFGNASLYIWILGWIPFRLEAVEWLYRVPAALFGTSAVGLFFALFAWLDEHRLGVTGALLLAMLPYHVAFSQEVHSYSLLSLVVVGVLIGTIRLANGFSLSLFALLVLVSVAGMTVGLFSAFLVLPVFLVAMISFLSIPTAERGPALRPDGSQRTGLLLTLAGLALVGLPIFLRIWHWVVAFAQQLLDGNSDEKYFQTPPRFFFGKHLLTRILNEMSVWKADEPRLAAVLWLLVLWGLMAALIWRRRLGVVCILWVVCQLPLIVGFSHQARLDLGSRRFMTVFPALVVLMAVGLLDGGGLLGRLVGRWPRLRTMVAGLPVVVLCGVIFAGPLRTYWCCFEKPAYRLMARLHEDLRAQGVYVTAWKPYRLEFYGTPDVDPCSWLKVERLEREYADHRAALYTRPRALRTRDHFKDLEAWFSQAGGRKIPLGGGNDLWFACRRLPQECSDLVQQIAGAIEQQKAEAPVFCAADRICRP